MPQFKGINYLLLQFLIAIISIVNTTLPPIPSTAKIDEKYSKLLGLPLKEDGKSVGADVPSFGEFDHSLKQEIEALLLSKTILQMFLDVSEERLSDEQKKFFEKKMENLHHFFDVADKEHFTLSRICEIWKFWRQLGDDFAKNNLLEAEGQKYVQTRQIITAPKKVNCLKIEQLIKEKKEFVQLFVDELKLLHFNAIKFIMTAKYDGQSQKWEFSKLFDEEMMPNETNLAFQLRLLHANGNSVEILRHIKTLLIEHLVGVHLYALEAFAPAIFAPEIVDERTLADKYMGMVTKNSRKAAESDAEMGTRIYLGQIWRLLERFYRRKKGGENFGEDFEELLNGRSEKLFGFKKRYANAYTLACHELWQTLATLYNNNNQNDDDDGSNKQQQQQQQHVVANAASLDEKNEIKNQNANTAEALQNELVEEHIKNIGQLMGGTVAGGGEGAPPTTNAFREHFRTAAAADNAASKDRLKWFIFSKIGSGGKSEQQILQKFAFLMRKFPFMEDLVRIELTEKQIEGKQIKHYIDFLDAKNGKKVAKIARFVLHLLAYHQWFKSMIVHLQNDSKFEHLINKCVSSIQMWVQSVEDGENLSEFETDYFAYLADIRQKMTDYIGELNANGAERSVPENDQIEMGTMALKAMHGENVGRLLKRKAFRDGLKRIEINKKRLSEIVGDGTAIFVDVLQNESHKRKNEQQQQKGKEPKIGKGSGASEEKPRESPKATKGQHQNTSKSEQQNNNTSSEITSLVHMTEAANIVALYQQFLSTEMSAFAVRMFNASAAHFRFKDLLNSFLGTLCQIDTAHNDKLQRLKTLILRIVHVEKFGDQLTDIEAMKRSICAMDSFLTWLAQNGTLHSLSGVWQKFLANVGKNEGVQHKIGPPSDDDFVWHKTDCENEQNYNKIFDEITNVRTIRCLHWKLIVELSEHIPHFANFLEDNAHTFPTIRKLSMEQRISNFYEIIFDPQSGEETARAKEMELALIRAVTFIVYWRNGRQKVLKSEYQKAFTELFLTLRLIELLGDDDKMQQTVRMLCTVLPFFTLVMNREKHGKVVWTTTTEHYLSADLDTDQVFADQRAIMVHFHVKFFWELLSNAPMDHPVIKHIRETFGTLYKLNVLVGSDELHKLMENEHVPSKLVDKTLFTNQNRLLMAHYAQIVCDQRDDAERQLPNRVMADLIVLINDDHYFGPELMGTILLTDLWWLHFRLLYETIAAEPSEAPKSALLIINLLEEMDKFLDSSKKLASNAKKSIGRAWHLKEKEAIARTEVQWFEAKDGQSAPNERVQQKHMEMVQKLGTDEAMSEEFKQFVDALQNNSECRKNLLQILTVDDAIKLLQMLGVKYAKNEFENGKNNVENEGNNNKEKGQIGTKNDAKNDGPKKRNKKKGGKKWAKIEKGVPSATTENKEILDEEKSDPKEKSDQEIVQPAEKRDQIIDQPKEKSDQEIVKPTEKRDQIIDQPKEKSDQKTDQLKEKSDQKIEQRKEKSKEAKIEGQNEQKIGGADKAEKWHKNESKLKTKKEQISANICTLSDACEYEPLVHKYEKGILHYLDLHQKEMLDLCALKKEIEIRIGTLTALNQIGKRANNLLEATNDGQNSIENWREQNAKLGTMPSESKSDFLALEEKLYEILRQILTHQNGRGQNIGTNDSKSYEMQNVKTQIHLKNILLALQEQKEFGKIWTTFGVEEKWKKLHFLLRVRMPIMRFDTLMEEYRKMMEQIEIDQALFEGAKIAHCGDGNCLPPNFAKSSQQITISHPMDIVKKSGENFENYLTSFIYKSCEEKTYETKIENALRKISAIVENWSDGLAKLLISGSLLLSAHTIGSDVNLVCVTPGERLKVRDFMGNDKSSKCADNKKCTDEANSSLFCQICEHQSTLNVVKIESDSILIIRFQFDDIEFDISLVAIPKKENLEMEQINVQMLEQLLNNFNLSIIEHKNMGRTLASYRSTLYMANLFYDTTTIKDCMNSFAMIVARQKAMSENGRSFRHLLMATKIWAKNNGIYSNKMGFLNGMALAIMVAKIVLLYPSSSLQFMLEKFFLFFSTRPAYIPLQLTTIEAHHFDALSAVINPKEMEMPVLTPTFSPLQNATRFVTHSNAKVIRQEMAEALHRMNSMKNQSFDIGALLSVSIPFIEKYPHFLAINCMAEEKELANSFCAFVEWRMRLQIIFDIDKKGGTVQTHLNPNVVQQENCNLSSKLVDTTFSPNFCKLWLLGIISTQINPVELLGMAKKFDLTIESHFHKIRTNSRENSANLWSNGTPKLELKTLLVKREKLLKLVEEKK